MVLAALRQFQGHREELDTDLRLRYFPAGDIPSPAEAGELCARIAQSLGSAAEGDLPKVAFAVHPENGAIIKITRGSGKYATTSIPKGVTAGELNLAIGVTPAQARAMLHGLMSGWRSAEDIPEDPGNQEKTGAPHE